ncbi:MAG: arylamine N-acetyltransferase [Holosporales bacterium]|jgi:arylamine N-acetyltransferase|nr:arylamine N-acetyltransferase [Holosporales bacterium]
MEGSMYKLLKTCVLATLIACVTSSVAMSVEEKMKDTAASVSLVEQYSEVIGVPKETLLVPSIDALRFIVSKHVERIPYQNFGIFYDKKASDLSVEALIHRLLIQKEGGACYETSELLFNVLNSVGYDVKRIAAFPLNNKPFNPRIPSSHNVLLVKIEGRSLLVDVGYGINSVRFPILFGFSETEEQEVFTNEKYQLVCAPDYYQLNLQIKGEWASLYRFDRPLKFIDLAQTTQNFQSMFACSEMLPIRDIYVKSSILTPDGRIGFYVEPNRGMSSAYKFIDYKGEVSKEFYKTSQELVEDIFKTTGLKAPGAMLAIEPGKDDETDHK